jgi:allophanate hydrolase
LTNDLSFEIGALHAAYGSGLSPEAVIDEALRRLAAADDDGIFLHLRPRDALLAEARALGAFDPARPLWGIPFAVKDNIDVAGCPTTAACPAFAYHPETDAFVVAALRAAGAIPLGKTNLDQFATGLVGLRSPYKAPRNALDPAIIPGGSSSGSAVAVARGIVSFALGTDTAGSGRVPAALNNIVGLKPTLGMLSNSGVVPACRTLDTISIFALSVPDAHRAFRAASVYDPADAFARPIPSPAPGPVPTGLRIGVPDAQTRLFFGDKAQAGAFASTLSELDAMGATLVEVDFTPFYDVAKMLYEGAWVAERMTVIEPLLRRDPQAIHPVTRQIVAAADKLSAADAFRGIYRLAELKRLAEPVLDSLDLLCVPTIPTFYTVADLQADPIGPNSRLGTYTNFVNLMNLCGLAVPTAPRADGRPGSVTLLARAGRDAALAALADALHRRADVPLGATPHRLCPAQVAPLAVTADETVLAVAGAHMSGLPLNSHLTARGARFLEETATAPEYRFYALPGGPPIRPGLVRTTRNGRSVTLELWAMPTARMGDFLATIPAPLGLGPVRLADGRTVTGFLAEAAGTEGATDISAFAGWRAFLDAQG